jgi:hypothetical protein
VKIKNNFGRQICFSSCYPYFLEKKNEKWESYKYAECQKFDGNGHCITAGDLKAFELTLPEGIKGIHRLAVPVCIGCKSQDPFKETTRFYSNEFTIKEKKEEVTVTTDKTEYNTNETVRITVKNNSDKSIFNFEVCGNKPWWRVQKFEGGQWKEINFSFPILKSEPVIPGYPKEIEAVCEFIFCEKPELSELRPDFENTDEWQLYKGICEWPLKPIGIPKTKPKPIETGTYRLFVIYGFHKDFNSTEARTIYSNEFTIK